MILIKSKTKSKILMLVVVQVFVLVTMVSSTVAWFATQTAASAGISNIIMVGENISVKLKYFKGNYVDSDTTKAYSGYIEPGELTTPSRTLTGDKTYDTEFVDSNLESKYYTLSNIVPGSRFTFAAEVVVENNKNSTIVFTLNSFSNFFNDLTTKNYVLSGTSDDTVTTRRVGLADAINIYTSEFTYNDTATDAVNLTNVTTTANTLVTTTTANLASSDKLSFDSKTNIDNGTAVSGTTTDETMFSSSITLDSSDYTPGNKHVIFFTIEFSNQTDTYYSSKTPTSGDIVPGATYWYKDATNGSSNVYKNTGFKLNELKFTKTTEN